MTKHIAVPEELLEEVMQLDIVWPKKLHTKLRALLDGLGIEPVQERGPWRARVTAEPQPRNRQPQTRRTRNELRTQPNRNS